MASTVEPRASGVSTAGCPAGLGYPVFHERLKTPNTSIYARMPQQMLISLKTEARAIGPTRPSQEGGRWVAGTWPGCAGPAAPAGLRGGTGDGLGHKQGGKDWKAITAGPVSLKVAAHRDVGASRLKLGDRKQPPCLWWVGCSTQSLVLVNKTLELASRPIANARFQKFTTFFFF